MLKRHLMTITTKTLSNNYRMLKSHLTISEYLMSSYNGLTLFYVLQPLSITSYYQTAQNHLCKDLCSILEKLFY